MFRTIELLNHEVVDDDKLQATFNINDTCFSQETSIIGPTKNPVILGLVGVIQVYSKRRLNVARNLAYYYHRHDKGKLWLDLSDKPFMDKHFPQLQFGNRYHKLVHRYYR